jgi:predicted enzyme related to lactoylglutathione lyase
MSERDGYQHGVPCWVDTGQPDAQAAVGFYTELFGWEVENAMPADSEGTYFMCRLRGRDVAAVGSQPPEAGPPVPAWNTYVWVESADDTRAKVTDAGGSVVMEPFDVLDAGRMAVMSDPSGAVFSVWQANAHQGARLVNEPGAWSMNMLNTRDPEGAKAFYGAVFGWETEAFDLGGAPITLWRLPGYVGGEPQQPVPRDVIGVMAPMTSDGFPDDVPSHWSVDFWVDDVDAAADTAARLGGKVIAPPYEIPGAPMRQAVLADPAGATFSVTRVGPPV